MSKISEIEARIISKQQEIIELLKAQYRHVEAERDFLVYQINSLTQKNDEIKVLKKKN